MSLLPALSPWQQRAYEHAAAAIDAGHFVIGSVLCWDCLL